MVVKKPLNTWYVSAYIPDKEKTGYYSRRSQSFTSDSDAKAFAAAELAAGVEVSAGTINPVVPKRIVGPSQIRKWLAEKIECPRAAGLDDLHWRPSGLTDHRHIRKMPVKSDRSRKAGNDESEIDGGWVLKCLKRMARETGLEPAASAVTGRRSNQLSYCANELGHGWD